MTPTAEHDQSLQTGKEVVVEEFLTGPEISVLAISDGYSIVPLPAAQDHKRIGEADTGPNTGGMGAYAPAPVATPDVLDNITKEVLRPTIDGMRKEGESKLLHNIHLLEPACRISFRWNSLHRIYPHSIGPKGARI